MAVCSVDGGPDYDVPIAGDSSFINHKLSAYDLDFGEIAYNESTTKDFYIENVGKVLSGNKNYFWVLKIIFGKNPFLV